MLDELFWLSHNIGTKVPSTNIKQLTNIEIFISLTDYLVILFWVNNQQCWIDGIDVSQQYLQKSLTTGMVNHRSTPAANSRALPIPKSVLQSSQLAPLCIGKGSLRWKMATLTKNGSCWYSQFFIGLHGYRFFASPLVEKYYGRSENSLWKFKSSPSTWWEEGGWLSFTISGWLEVVPKRYL